MPSSPKHDQGPWAGLLLKSALVIGAALPPPSLAASEAHASSLSRLCFGNRVMKFAFPGCMKLSDLEYTRSRSGLNGLEVRVIIFRALSVYVAE